MKRVLANILLFVSIGALPIWLFCILLVVFSLYFISPLELILYGFLIDVLVATNGSVYVYTLFAIALYYIVQITKQNMRTI